MNNNLIQTQTYSRPKGSGQGGSRNITYNITASSLYPADINAKNINTNKLHAEYVESNVVKAGKVDTVYVVASDGTISTLRGNSLNYDSGTIRDLQANNIVTDDIKGNTATIEQIFNNYLNTKEITTDYLNVNKGAHFFEVVIDKIRSVEGTIINTACSSTIDYVEPIGATGYKCYWKETDDNGQYVANDWKVNDQAISQNCNLVSGVNHNTGNHYYWRLVKEKSAEPIYVNFDTGETSHGDEVEGDNNETLYVTPKYRIEFGDDFVYDNVEEIQPPQQGRVRIDGWNITGQIADNWDDEMSVLTVEDTLNGIQLIPNQIIDSETNLPYTPFMSKGKFTFTTSLPTKLNVAFYFDDDTVEYHPAPENATDTYDINIVDVNNAVVSRIVITSAVVNIWHSCHWIVLSNISGEYDQPTHLDPNDFDMTPAIGDNIVQLGYRGNDDPERGSAIIIAAYQTPDDGGTYGGVTYNPVYPPSYAQYMGINDFVLCTHRGTYMDRTGSYIKGNLVTETGHNIPITDQGLDVVVDQWKLVSPVSNIWYDGNTVSPSSITLDLLHVTNTTSEILHSLPSGFLLKVNNVVQTSLLINNLTNQDYYFELIYDDGNTDKVLDSLYVNCQSTNALDGQDADLTEMIFIKGTDTTHGSLPNSLQKKFTDYTSLEKAGWSLTMPAADASLGEVIWMSMRNITYNVNNVATYRSWSTANRVTSLNGAIGPTGPTGKDGDGIEYIYTRTASNTVPDLYNTIDVQINTSYITSYDPIYNPSTGNTSYLITRWNNSYVGEMTRTNSDYLPPSYFDINSYNTSTIWYDEPKGLTGIYTCEWVSQRKYDGETQQWGQFTNPSIWSLKGDKGEDGTDGINGTDGRDGVSDKLIPIRELYEVRTSATNDYNNIISQLYTNLRYKVFHIEGDSVSQATDLSHYTISAHIKSQSGSIKSYNMKSLQRPVGFAVDNGEFVFMNGDDAYLQNMLAEIYPSTVDYQDYNKLSHNADANTLLPIEMIVRLSLDGVVVDERHVDVIFKAGSIFAVTESALNSVFFGSWQGSTGIVNSVSSIHQDMQGIQTQVTAISNDYITSSQLSQTATAISASVYQTIDGDLRETGIDIENGKITLQAGNVIFTDGQGATNTNISIDPTTGTLHATNGDFVNGNFSGIVTANVSYTPFITISGGADKTLNPANDGGCRYRISANTDSVEHTFTLPQASNWSGLEMKFLYTQGRSASEPIKISGYMIYPIEGATDSPNIIWPANSSLIEMISVNGAWYITNGSFYVEQTGQMILITI